jgi:LacI family transcriptional regulator
MPDQITLDDVARLCGVSRATASRALNGRAGVRDDVRDRIRRIADSMGFVPNRAAKQLASGRSSVIGLVIPSADLHIDPYGASITHAVGRAAHQQDQGLMLHLANKEPGSTVHHIMRDGLVDGLLVSSVAVGVPWIDELLAQDNLPTVLVGTHPWIANFDAVDVENLESSAAAVDHLFQVGCRRVGTITGLLDRADAVLRLDGYRLAHERRGIEVDEDLIVVGDFNRDSGYKGAQVLVERGVDGIFAANDETAIGVMWAMVHAGVRIPDDVALVGFDGTSVNDFLQPTLSSVRQPFEEIAQAAVIELLRRIDGQPSSGPIVLDGELVIGGSSQRAKPATKRAARSRGRTAGAQ